MLDREQVIQANIQLHTHLASQYRTSEPHYRPENVNRVASIVQAFAKTAPVSKLLDVGCGMGFMIDIAKQSFDEIEGIDVTPAMLQQIDTKSDRCKIHLQIAQIEKMPFAESTFGACTAYAVLHHLHDLIPAFKEIYRVLKPGGVFYTDTDPNHYFWKAFSNTPDSEDYTDIVKRELYAVKYKDQELESEFGVDPKVLRDAEMIKHVAGGLREEDLRLVLTTIGFSSVEIRYEWFLGEAKLIHSGHPQSTVDAVRNHLRDMLPLSRHLFKYVSILATK